MSHVEPQLILVETQAGRLWVILVGIACETCGTHTLTLAAHHAEGVIQALQTALAQLPQMPTSEVH